MIRTGRLLVVCAAFGVAAACAGPTGDRPAVRVTVPRGATLTAVAESLHAHGVITSPRRFRWYATATGKQRAIQAGTYEFRPGTSIRAALTILVSGRELLVPITFPEGLMAREIAELLEAELGIPPDSFTHAIADSGLRASVGTTAATLEGYLYPSTYYVRVGTTARDMVAQMVREFEARWDDAWNARLDTLNLTRHELVILASIIEGEVRYAPDRAYVSSVYHNRLARRMRLQADPTVIYALGRRRRLFLKDYRVRSPYNTYLINGLPPGPIGQPSEPSLKAALYPATTDYLFLVAQDDGKHVFSRTLREHNAAIRRIRP